MIISAEVSIQHYSSDLFLFNIDSINNRIYSKIPSMLVGISLDDIIDNLIITIEVDYQE